MFLSKAPNPNCSRRAGCRLAWLTPPSVCESVRECEANIVQHFGWPMVRKALCKCGLFTFVLQCLEIVLYINITFCCSIMYIMYCIVIHVISLSKAMFCIQLEVLFQYYEYCVLR